MNDDTLTTALDRMATALEPPVGADELINARRSQLRRRRRVATGLTVASVFAIIATGGVMASGLGNADPAPDNVPVNSEGPAPADAVDDAASSPEVKENDSPWQCADELTPAEIEQFENEVIDMAQLSLDDAAGRTIHGYVIIPEDRNVVFEVDVRRVGEQVEIVSVTRCG